VTPRQADHLRTFGWVEDEPSARIARHGIPVNPELQAALDKEAKRRAAEVEDPEPPQPFHPAPWWYRLAARVVPSRCREIPECGGRRILLRQVALVGRTVYLQGFASGEDPAYMHSHPGTLVLVLGIWGACSERRLGRARVRRRVAPYAYAMDDATIHLNTEPTRGHTSIVAFLGRVEPGPDREYFPADTRGVPWHEHTSVRVRRV
jgi:hypothetical protein